MEDSDTDIETVGSNDCKKILEDNKDANSILTII